MKRKRYTSGIRQRRDLAAALGDCTQQHKESWQQRRDLAVHTLESWQQGKLREQHQQRQQNNRPALTRRLAAAITKVAADAVGKKIAESSSGTSVYKLGDSRYLARGVGSETAALWDAVEEVNEAAAEASSSSSSSESDPLEAQAAAYLALEALKTTTFVAAVRGSSSSRSAKTRGTRSAAIRRGGSSSNSSSSIFATAAPWTERARTSGPQKQATQVKSDSEQGGGGSSGSSSYSFSLRLAPDRLGGR